MRVAPSRCMHGEGPECCVTTQLTGERSLGLRQHLVRPVLRGAGTSSSSDRNAVEQVRTVASN